MPNFSYSDLLPLGADATKYRLVSTEGVSVVKHGDKEFLQVEPSALVKLTHEAIHDINHYLRAEHLQQLTNIVKDPEASPNDRFVAIDLLKNANIAAGGVLPMCQDTGTALVMGKKGQYVLTTGKDEVAISQGIYDAYTKLNLRYSQMAPVTTWEEKNTGNNLPAQIEIYADSDHQDEYNFMFIAKGGGSANKSFLYQETKAVLNPTAFMNWLDEKLRSIGTAACPPYHLAIVIGGTSAEATVKTAKLASTKYLDSLPTKGSVKYLDNQGNPIDSDLAFKQITFAAPYSEIIEEFTISELISFLVGLQNLPSAFNVQAFEEFSELKTNPNKLIRDFSSGMKQKTKLTLALSAPRPFLFLDEPTTNLDLKSKTWFQNKLESEKDKLILIASNEESEIKYCQERIQILDFK